MRFCKHCHKNYESLDLLILLVLIFSILLLLCTFVKADIVVDTIAYESSNQPFKGQVAVAKVIQNRARERKQTFKEVVFAKHQFSCWKKGKPTQSRKLTRKERRIANKAWEMAFKSTFSANLYHHKGISPSWSRSPKVTKLKTIANHVFYREKR